MELLGGLIGAVFVTATLIAAPKIGVTGMIVATLAGNMVAAILIDRFGWVGISPRPIDLPRVAGVLLDGRLDAADQLEPGPVGLGRAPAMSPGALILVLALLSCSVAPSPSGARPPERKLRIVFFTAHPDDPMWGAAGLMALLSRDGHEVISAYGTCFRRGRRVGEEPEADVRRREAAASCKVVGATPKFFDYSHEEFVPAGDVLKTVSAWLEEVRPDIVVTHWPTDTHPNHHAAASLVWQCYRPRGGWTLYWFELLGSRQTVDPAAALPRSRAGPRAEEGRPGVPRRIAAGDLQSRSRRALEEIGRGPPDPRRGVRRRPRGSLRAPGGQGRVSAPSRSLPPTEERGAAG